MIPTAATPATTIHKPLPPPMKAVGGKRWLAPTLSAEIMEFQPDLYVEPFVGGGAVMLALPVELPKIISDTNPAVYAIWRALKIMPEPLLTKLSVFRSLYPNTADGYKEARDRLNECLDDPNTDLASTLALAAISLHINKRCFNGLWRTNSNGQFNTPWGNYERPRDLTDDEIRAYATVLRLVEVVPTDFRVTLHSIHQYPGKRVAIFIDSPYHGTFSNYTAERFDEIDQRELAQWLKWLTTTRSNVAVWATNSDTPLIRELYSPWAELTPINEQHNVGAKANRRGKRGCLLIRSRSK